MYDYFRHGFHTLSVIKHVREKKAQIQIRLGTLGQILYQMGVCGVICISLGVLDIKKFEMQLN